MFKEVRRQNRILEDKLRIMELLNTSEYGILNLGSDESGYGYGIPLNHAYDEKTNSLYFHCATEGKKLDIMKLNNKVSYCIVGAAKPVADKFTTLYESVIVFGKAELDLSENEKRKALRLLVKKYSQEYEELGEKYIDKSWDRTYTFKICIEHLTAKSNMVNQ